MLFDNISQLNYRFGLGFWVRLGFGLGLGLGFGLGLGLGFGFWVRVWVVEPNPNPKPIFFFGLNFLSGSNEIRNMRKVARDEGGNDLSFNITISRNEWTLVRWY